MNNPYDSNLLYKALLLFVILKLMRFNSAAGKKAALKSFISASYWYGAIFTFVTSFFLVFTALYWIDKL